MMQDPSHCSHQFLELYDKVPEGWGACREGKLLKLSSKKHRTWLTPVVHKSNSFIARYTQAILNHAPIGSYRRRFRVGDFENTKCTCSREETREHILEGCIWTTCRRYTTPHFSSLILHQPLWESGGKFLRNSPEILQQNLTHRSTIRRL